MMENNIQLPEDQNQFYYAPFTEQRRSIRRTWNKLKNMPWEEYLKLREQKYQQQLKADQRSAIIF